jgi:hypothetical protein
MAAFQAAAAALREKREEEELPVEERIAKHIRQWCDAWQQDLDARPEAVKASGAGEEKMALSAPLLGG